MMEVTASKATGIDAAMNVSGYNVDELAIKLVLPDLMHNDHCVLPLSVEL